MTLSAEQHLDNLLRHIDLVREACTLLGRRLMARGRQEFGRLLISKGHIHDVSKFAGIEWDYLHAGKDVPRHLLDLAMRQHVLTNSHHPEFHGGFEEMPEIAVAEMVCDWYARAQEFATGLRDWITKEAIDRYKIDINGEKYRWVVDFVDILLEDQFVR